MDPQTGWITLSILLGYPAATLVVATLTWFFEDLWDRWISPWSRLGTRYEALLFAALVVAVAGRGAGLFDNLPLWAAMILGGINAVMLAYAAGGLAEQVKRRFAPSPPSPPAP